MCRYCDELIACAYVLKESGEAMALHGKVLIFNKDNQVKFWYSESKEKAPDEWHHCPYCQADLQAKLNGVAYKATMETSGVCKKKSLGKVENLPKSHLKKLGDFTLREIRDICYKNDSCITCILADGGGDCLVGCYRFVHDSDKQEYLNKEICTDGTREQD